MTAVLPLFLPDIVDGWAAQFRCRPVIFKIAAAWHGAHLILASSSPQTLCYLCLASAHHSASISLLNPSWNLCAIYKVFEGPVVSLPTSLYVIMQESEWITVGVWTFHCRTCATCMLEEKKILLNPHQVVILVFKVDWSIHGIIHALNNMQDNIPP